MLSVLPASTGGSFITVTALKTDKRLMCLCYDLCTGIQWSHCKDCTNLGVFNSCHLPFSGNWWPAWKHFVFIITNFGGRKVSKWKERFCSPPFYILSADNRCVPGYYPEYLLQYSAKTFPYLFRESGQCSSWEQTEQCISDVFLFSPKISSLFCNSCCHQYSQFHQ